MLPLSYFIIAIETILLVFVLFIDDYKILSRTTERLSSSIQTDHKRKREVNFSAYRQCLLDGVFEANKSQTYLKLPGIVAACEKAQNLTERLGLIAVQNRDEVKYLRKPQIAIPLNEECNVVTLGVGLDVSAEEKMKLFLPPTCRFSGADPIEQGNREAFNGLGGSFFPVAVSGTNGKQNASVYGLNGSLIYQDHEFEHIDFITFLKNLAKVKGIVDYLLMDNESAEYEILPYFAVDGELDHNGIVVCQWICEFHWRGNEHFSDFVIKDLVSGKFLPFRTHRPGHVRTHLLNVIDEICLQRYLPDFL